MESHRKEICFQKIEGKKITNLKKITNESETGFNFSGNKDKRVQFMHYNAGKYML